jgi:hypothetical protein
VGNELNHYSHYSYSNAPSETAIELTLVAPLVEATKRLRRAARLHRRDEWLAEIAGTAQQLDDILHLWGPRLHDLKAVRQWVEDLSRDLRGLVDFRGSVGEQQQRTFALHYLLETIPSQIVAALEQGRIDRKEAPSRFDFLNAIVAQRGSRSYLEIGCYKNDCFNSVNCPQRVGVDPASGGTLKMTSDEFFAVNQQHFDLIFIDGLHEAWQVDRDISNALRWLTPNGVIVMHDCNPRFDIRTLAPQVSETWNGDTWKSLVRVRSRGELDCATGSFDHGCGVILPRPNSAPCAAVPDVDLVWENLCEHRATWLRPMEFGDILRWIGPSER